ncbi:alpha-amylase family glycosyl hydrolase [Mycoplasma todarodis]|uniref:alpha-amylase family glycosyl hydrolase n=1 Tax=Mycoplasma todarodis TaxID=1937191 RepID=UPI003B38F9D6
MNKKIFFYEVEPKFFRDSTGNGCGDLKGLADKFDYFKFLGVDMINLPNLLSAYSDDTEQGFKAVSKTYGSIADLKKVIELSKKHGIKISVEINIGTIKDTHKWFKNASDQEFSFKDIVDFKPEINSDITEGEYKYNEKTKSYYLINERTQEVVLNWTSEETVKKFIEVVQFWRDLGIEGFVFTNFEQINYGSTDGELMTDETLRQLRNFYQSIKEIDENIIVVGKSSKLDEWAAKDFTKGERQVFDYTQLTAISLLGTSKQFGNDKIGKFTQGSLVKKISRLVDTNKNILTFGSSEVGRITSRWGDANQYHAESAKAIALLLLTTPGSSSVYYGDELGMKNIGLTNLDDFQDITIHERKRALANQKVSEKEFMAAQILQHPINARGLMAWNTDKNGGFSESNETVTPISEQFKQINVEAQFMNKYSPLNFYREVIKLSKESKYKNIFNEGTYKISSQKLGLGVIQIVRKYKDQEIHMLINFSNKEKNVTCPKTGGMILLSTYGQKRYSELPKSLLPFEGIVIVKGYEERIVEPKPAIKQEPIKQQIKEEQEIVSKEVEVVEPNNEVLVEESQENISKEVVKENIIPEAELEKQIIEQEAPVEAPVETKTPEEIEKERQHQAHLATQRLIEADQKAQREKLERKHQLQKEEFARKKAQQHKIAQLEKETTHELKVAINNEEINEELEEEVILRDMTTTQDSHVVKSQENTPHNKEQVDKY